MCQHLQYAVLEKAIYQKIMLSTLNPLFYELLAHYQIVDYIANPSVKEGLSTFNAQAFFEDQGAYRETFYLVEADAKKACVNSVVLFATFIVIEINKPHSQLAFLVLAPKRENGLEASPYLGLMKSQNTDTLREVLASHPSKIVQLTHEIIFLLNYLRGETAASTQKQTAKGFLGSLKHIFSKSGKSL